MCPLALSKDQRDQVGKLPHVPLRVMMYSQSKYLLESLVGEATSRVFYSSLTYRSINSTSMLLLCYALARAIYWKRHL